MTNERFVELTKARMQAYSAIMGTKGQEYSRRDDRMWNFKKIARWNNLLSSECGSDVLSAIWQTMGKHVASVSDVVDDLRMMSSSNLPTKELVAEKFGDFHVYLHLLEAAVIDAMDGGSE